MYLLGLRKLKNTAIRSTRPEDGLVSNGDIYKPGPISLISLVTPELSVGVSTLRDVHIVLKVHSNTVSESGNTWIYRNMDMGHGPHNQHIEILPKLTGDFRSWVPMLSLFKKKIALTTTATFLVENIHGKFNIYIKAKWPRSFSLALCFHGSAGKWLKRSP